MGLSYGIITKQDNQNKLVSSKKRGNRSKEFSPKKNKTKGMNLVENIYRISAPIDQELIVMQGNQISYDDQSAFSPTSGSRANIMSTAKSHSRLIPSTLAQSIKQSSIKNDRGLITSTLNSPTRVESQKVSCTTTPIVNKYNNNNN